MVIIWSDLFQCGLFSYQSSLLINFNHSIRMSDGQVMAKIQSWSRKNITEKLLEHSSTLNAFLSPNGSKFGLTYFNVDCSPIILVYVEI